MVDAAAIDAVTLDFGNTLVPVTRAGLARVVGLTGERIAAQLGPFDVDAFLTAWSLERQRQFREEVPRFREVDLPQRLVRVLARLRGMAAPADDEPWDDARAGRLSAPEEIAWGVNVYSEAFVAELPAPPAVARVLEQLAARRRLAILSNWPLAATIDRYVAAAGWDRWLGPIVVSQRVGTIKPHPAIFAAALAQLGNPPAARVLHVGDDWAADVVGAKEAGWRAAWLTGAAHDSPLPSSDRDQRVTPDLEITRLEDLVAALASPDEHPARDPRRIGT
jgi:HAD superfamily hydrolase (TIGR01509 family)